VTQPLVVLLHGLARGHGSMAGLGKHLRDHGYETWSRSYPSRKHSIAYLAEAMADQIAEAANGRSLHAITHSMGGLIVRHLHDPRLHWQRIVMLAPPNRGSQLAAGLARNPVFRWYFGPAGVELGSGAGWPAPPAPFAVIAGTRSLALLNPTSWTVGRRFGAGIRNDGTVTVDETKLEGMSDFAEVDATHTWIMNSPLARQLAVDYLRDERFTSIRT
jgi:triacylglycerol lipase